MLSWRPARCGMMWSTSRVRKGNSLRHPLHRPSCWPKSTCLFVLAVGHRRVDVSAPGGVGAGRNQAVVTGAHGCSRRMLTSSTALGEMSMPIQRRPRFSAATQAVAQPQAEGGQPKGAGSENSPHFSQMKAPGRRQAVNLPLPTFVRGRRRGSAWPEGLRFGRRGYSEHRMLLVTRLPLYCTAPRQLRILSLLDVTVHV